MTSYLQCGVLYVAKGMQSGHDAFEPEVPFWSAYRTQNYGYSRLHITNATHMLVEWVSVAIVHVQGRVTPSQFPLSMQSYKQ